MPRHAVVSREVVREALAAHGNAHAAAKALGMRPNTVLAISRELNGRCSRCNGEREGEGQNCSKCAAYMREHARKFRKGRMDSATCIRCTEPVDPESKQFCSLHREVRKSDASRYRKERLASRPEAFRDQVSKWNRKAMYGDAGVAVWNRTKGDCQICDAPRRRGKSHIHHIDLNKENNAEENLICVCENCHRLLHQLQWHPALERFLPWFRKVYPDVRI